MKKSLCLLLSIVSSCYSFVQATQIVTPLTSSVRRISYKELLGALDVSAPKKRSCLVKPECIGALAAGFVVAAYGKPVVKSVKSLSQIPSLSHKADLLLAGFGASIAGVGLYTFVGKEIGVIVTFKSIIKQLTAHLSEWHNIIIQLQTDVAGQEVKIAQAQMLLGKMQPLMEQLVQQVSNEQILAKAVGHLYMDSASMIDRVKTIEKSLQMIASLSAQQTESAAVASTQELKKLFIKSNNIFGKPTQVKKNYWWSFGITKSPSFVCEDGESEEV